MNITKRQLKRIISEMVTSRMQQRPSDEIIEELGLYDYIDEPLPSRRKSSSAADIFVEGRIKITKSQLRKIIREQIMHEAEEETEVFDPEDVDAPIPNRLAKLLDPDIAPAMFAKLDKQMRETGSLPHQAFAIMAFAMSYAGNDTAAALKLLNRAKDILPKIAKKMKSDSASTKEKEGEGEGAETASGDVAAKLGGK